MAIISITGVRVTAGTIDNATGTILTNAPVIGVPIAMVPVTDAIVTDVSLTEVCTRITTN